MPRKPSKATGPRRSSTRRASGTSSMCTPPSGSAPRCLAEHPVLARVLRRGGAPGRRAPPRRRRRAGCCRTRPHLAGSAARTSARAPPAAGSPRSSRPGRRTAPAADRASSARAGWRTPVDGVKLTYEQPARKAAAAYSELAGSTAAGRGQRAGQGAPGWCARDAARASGSVEATLITTTRSSRCRSPNSVMSRGDRGRVWPWVAPVGRRREARPRPAARSAPSAATSRPGSTAGRGELLGLLDQRARASTSWPPNTRSPKSGRAGLLSAGWAVTQPIGSASPARTAGRPDDGRDGHRSSGADQPDSSTHKSSWCVTMHGQPKLGCRKRAGEIVICAAAPADSAENAARNMKLGNTIPCQGPNELRAKIARESRRGNARNCP